MLAWNVESEVTVEVIAICDSLWGAIGRAKLVLHVPDCIETREQRSKDLRHSVAIALRYLGSFEETHPVVASLGRLCRASAKCLEYVAAADQIQSFRRKAGVQEGFGCS
jgi:hypothetical protein